MARAETDGAKEKAAPKRKPSRRQTKDQERAERLALIVALEVRRMLEDVLFRKGLLVEVWSKMRARKPLLNTLRSRYDEIPATDLMLLPADVILEVERFYRVVDEFRLYLESTEDMPGTLENYYVNYSSQMEQVGLSALAALQPLHGRNLNMGPQGVKGGELLEIAPFEGEDG